MRKRRRRRGMKKMKKETKTEGVLDNSHGAKRRRQRGRGG